MTLLFESFLVYYLIQLVVIALGLAYIYWEPPQPKKKIHDPWGFFKN